MTCTVHYVLQRGRFYMFLTGAHLHRWFPPVPHSSGTRPWYPAHWSIAFSRGHWRKPAEACQSLLPQTWWCSSLVPRPHPLTRSVSRREARAGWSRDWWCMYKRMWRHNVARSWVGLNWGHAILVARLAVRQQSFIIAWKATLVSFNICMNNVYCTSFTYVVFWLDNSRLHAALTYLAIIRAVLRS